MNNFYCPGCGENSEVYGIDIVPGGIISIICPGCATKWHIITRYEEEEEKVDAA